MKRLFGLITCCIALLAPAVLSARSAVLVAHYGSSEAKTRAATLDLITSEIAEAFPDYEVRQSYISGVVRTRLDAKGEHVDSPTQALLRLAADGIDTVYVQPSTIIDGTETDEVNAAVEQMRPFFRHVAVGHPLCYSPSDCIELARILVSEPHDEEEAIIFVGHGNLLPSTATYSQLDLMVGLESDGSMRVSTIEGFPTAQTTAVQLKTPGYKKVKLVPLLLICGNHTRRDIAGDFADTLMCDGFQVETLMRGLAEVPAVRRLYVERVMKLTGAR